MKKKNKTDCQNLLIICCSIVLAGISIFAKMNHIRTNIIAGIIYLISIFGYCCILNNKKKEIYYIIIFLGVSLLLTIPLLSNNSIGYEINLFYNMRITFVSGIIFNVIDY